MQQLKDLQFLETKGSSSNVNTCLQHALRSRNNEQLLQRLIGDAVVTYR